MAFLQFPVNYPQLPANLIGLFGTLELIRGIGARVG